MPTVIGGGCSRRAWRAIFEGARHPGADRTLGWAGAAREWWARL